jgi:hypothetical protein
MDGMGALVVQHMGDLHGYEQVMVALIAFGPFVALGVVVVILRRRDAAAEAAEAAEAAAAADAPDVTEHGTRSETGR